MKKQRGVESWRVIVSCKRCWVSSSPTVFHHCDDKSSKTTAAQVQQQHPYNGSRDTLAHVLASLWQPYAIACAANNFDGDEASGWRHDDTGSIDPWRGQWCLLPSAGRHKVFCCNSSLHGPTENELLSMEKLATARTCDILTKKSLTTWLAAKGAPRLFFGSVCTTVGLLRLCRAG